MNSPGRSLGNSASISDVYGLRSIPAHAARMLGDVAERMTVHIGPPEEGYHRERLHSPQHSTTEGGADHHAPHDSNKARKRMPHKQHRKAREGDSGKSLIIDYFDSENNRWKTHIDCGFQCYFHNNSVCFINMNKLGRDMDSNQIKIMTLNIHNYHDFEQRKPRIIALIRRYDPDVVALQEVRDDRRKNKESAGQAEQLNGELNFEYFNFLRVNDINEANGLVGAPPCYEGLAILSRFPFSSDEVSLKKHKDDKYYRKVLVANVQIENRTIPVWVVHFSNNDLFAGLHAKETLIRAKLVHPIIIGDFNIRSFQEMKKLAGRNNYVSSSNYDYISFPEDNCSYDYILIPKTFSFLSFECISEEVSDHRALFAKINL